MLSQKKPLDIIAKTLLGCFMALQLFATIFLFVKVKRKPNIGYVDTLKIMYAILDDELAKNVKLSKEQGQAEIIQEKREKLQKMKDQFERIKNRKRNEYTMKLKNAITTLEAKIKKEEGDIDKEFQRKVNRDLEARVKDAIEAIEYVKEQRGCDIVYYSMPLAYAKEMAYSAPNQKRFFDRVTNVFCKSVDRVDVSADVLKKLGLESGTTAMY